MVKDLSRYCRADNRNDVEARYSVPLVEVVISALASPEPNS
jgi:hypothetical protein